VNRGVARNLLRGKKERCGDRSPPAGSQDRALVRVWGKAPRSRRHMLISSYNRGDMHVMHPCAPWLHHCKWSCSSGECRYLKISLVFQYQHRTVNVKNASKHLASAFLVQLHKMIFFYFNVKNVKFASMLLLMCHWINIYSTEHSAGDLSGE